MLHNFIDAWKRCGTTYSRINSSLYPLQQAAKCVLRHTHPVLNVLHIPTNRLAHALCVTAAAGDTVDYIVTGAWSKKACEEAGKFGLNVNVVAKGDNKSVPARDSWKLSPDAKYVHYCDNETIGGE
jgi:hypothetical protein